MWWFKVFALLPLFSMAGSITVPKPFPQEGFGGIEGFVSDQAGIPVAQAKVQVCNVMHGGCNGAISQSNGFYRIDSLAAGRYTLWAEAKRHSSEWRPMIVVEEGQITRQDIELKREIPTMDIQPGVREALQLPPSRLF